MTLGRRPSQLLRAAILGGTASLALAGCSDVVAEMQSAAATSFTCDDLADEAVRISDEDGGAGLKLLKVRNPQVVEDNRETYDVPQGNKEALILSCKGAGVWNTGGNSPVLVRYTVDSDGDEWVYYEPAR